MSYRICFDDLTTIHGTTNQSFSKCGEALSQLAENVTTFVGLPSLKGTAAERMKAYLEEVHGTLLASISELITEYQVRFLLYKDEMFQLDSDLHAELDEATFDSLLSFFPGSQSGFQTEAGDLKRVVDTISDLISEYDPSDSSINNDYGDIIHSITTLREEVGACEYTHASNDLNSFKALLSSFEGLIASYMGQNKSVTINYQSGSIADIPAAQQLNTAYINSQVGRVGLENQIKDAAGRDEQRFAQLEKEAAEARVDQGIWQAIGAIVTVVVGAVAIVATAGMATPIVVTALVAGSASMAYGYSNLAEAGQNIGFGLAGDATSAAINPLRDTLFMGNQTAYDVFGFAATFVAGSMIPIGSAVNIARSAGTSVTKAVIMGTGQSAVTAAAGYGGSKLGANLGYTISKDWFGADERTAQNISNATGLVGAVATAAGTYKVTSNIVNKALQPKPSNTHSKLGAETAEKASGANQKVLEEITNPVLEAPRSGSGLKVDDIKPVKGKGSVYDIDPLTGKPPTKQTQIIVDEFPSVPKAHGFSDIIDNYAGLAEVTDLGNAKLYQIQGSQNGVMGRFEWIIQDGKVTHRMFVRNPELNGVPIK